MLQGRDVLTGLCQVDGVGGDDYEEDHDLEMHRALLGIAALGLRYSSRIPFGIADAECITRMIRTYDFDKRTGKTTVLKSALRFRAAWDLRAAFSRKRVHNSGHSNSKVFREVLGPGLQRHAILYFSLVAIL